LLVARASGRDRSAAVVAAIPLQIKPDLLLLLLSPGLCVASQWICHRANSEPCVAGSTWFERSILVIQVIQPQPGGLADILVASQGAVAYLLEVPLHNCVFFLYFFSCTASK